MHRPPAAANMKPHACIRIIHYKIYFYTVYVYIYIKDIYLFCYRIFIFFVINGFCRNFAVAGFGEIPMTASCKLCYSPGTGRSQIALTVGRKQLGAKLECRQGDRERKLNSFTYCICKSYTLFFTQFFTIRNRKPAIFIILFYCTYSTMGVQVHNKKS